MSEFIKVDDELMIAYFDNAKEAFETAKLINTNNVSIEMFNEAPNSPWMFVVGICDICKDMQVFFAQEELYADGIIGCECTNCGNKCLYPKEGRFNV